MDDKALVEFAVEGVIVAHDHGDSEEDPNANVGVGKELTFLRSHSKKAILYFWFEFFT